MTLEDKVALYEYAILTEDQFASEVNIGDTGTGNEQINRLRQALNDTTDILEEATDRTIMYRGSAVTRYYSPAKGDSELILDEWPVLTGVSLIVYETDTRTYDSTTLLVQDTDYVLESSARGAKLIRTTSATGNPTAWKTGFRTVRVTAREGFRRTDQTTIFNDLLPGALRKAAARIAARIYAESKRQKHGIQSSTDPGGNTVRWSESYITITDAGIIRNHARGGMGKGRRGVKV